MIEKLDIEEFMESQETESFHFKKMDMEAALYRMDEKIYWSVKGFWDSSKREDRKRLINFLNNRAFDIRMHKVFQDLIWLNDPKLLRSLWKAGLKQDPRLKSRMQKSSRKRR